MSIHLATTVQILETGVWVAECHTPGCGWYSFAYSTKPMADNVGAMHEQATRFGRTA